MVAFHKDWRVSLTIADELMFRNKISTVAFSDVPFRWSGQFQMYKNFAQGRLLPGNGAAVLSASVFPICSKRTPTIKIRMDVSVVSIAFQLGGGD